MSKSQSTANQMSVAEQVPSVILDQATAAAKGNSHAEPDTRPTANHNGPPAAVPNAQTTQPGDLRRQHHGPQLSHRQRTVQEMEETPIEHAPPPVYSEAYGKVDFRQDGFNTQAHVADDGRVNININQRSRRLSELLVPALKSQAGPDDRKDIPSHPPAYIPPALKGLPGQAPPPPLNVVIHVVGSRGDVQPFVAVAKTLKDTYGHRVRLATHLTFKGFVEENGLEFFNIGGDPAELMAFMVKNPGLMPGMDSLRAGDVGKKRKSMYEIMQGCWRSCIEVGDGTGVSTITEAHDSRSSLDSAIGMESDITTKPFVADVIIANPPSFAHMHIAEKMGIPLHFMFTMPWSPTQAFSHPLANVQDTNADQGITNFVSYALVEMMTWQGLGDVINRFREKSLGLEPVSLMWAPGMATRLRIPYTYCWSPALIPKPKDWGPHIGISGFYFLSLASSYTPAPDLEAFLAAGPPPVYIGFGSIVVDDPNAMTTLIFDAVKKSGQRALVSKGWGGFGGDDLQVPEGIFMLGNVPHDWLFKHVSCVVHHGGAGTTAAGIAMGKPTIIVPFFGDQPFWGSMVYRAGAGPKPIPNKQLTAEKLAAAINEALQPVVLERAQEMAARIASEHGTEDGAKNFHSNLDISSLRCSLAPSRAACWRIKRTKIRLSAFAATVLGNQGLLDFGDLKLYRPKEYDTEDGPWDPVTGGASAIIGTFSSLAMGFADFPVEIFKGLRTKSHEGSTHAEGGEHTPRESTSSPRPSMSSLRESISSPQQNEFSNLETDVPARDGSQLSLASTSTSLSLKDTVGANSDALEEVTSPTSLQSPTSETTGHEGKHKARSDHRSILGHAIRRRSSSRHSRERSTAETEREDHHLRRSVSDHAHQAQEISLNTVIGAGRGAGRIVSAGLKSPMDFTFMLARGFHNAPKLYGDDKVRETEKVTDLQSGLKVAGKEFGYGLYDGVSGLLTQPIDGARKEGIAGFLKGFGKGIAGVVIKPQGAFWALQGYTFKGIYKEIQKHFGASTQNYIFAARTSQGYEEFMNATAAEKEDVVARWKTVKAELEKQKQLLKHGVHIDPEKCIFRKIAQERKVKASKKKASKPQHERSDSAATLNAADHPSTMQPDFQSHPSITTDPASSTASGALYEEAIQHSVARTSKGDAQQDEMIEKALRASVLELQNATQEGAHDEALNRAIEASVAEAARSKGGQHDKDLEEALRRSLQVHSPLSSSSRSVHRIESQSLDFEDSGIDTDDEEGGHSLHHNNKPKEQHGIAADDPTASTTSITNTSNHDSDLEKAIQESEKSHKEYQEYLLKQRAEEDIVLDYMKRQSLEEAKFKGSGGGDEEAAREGRGGGREGEEGDGGGRQSN